MKKAYLVLWAVLITITGCKGGDTEKDQKFVEAENMVYAAYQVRDYERILTLADSLKMEGLFSEGKACYWLGYANDRLMLKRMAELYWKTGLAATANSTEDEDVRVYAGIANRLTGLECMWGEYETAMKVAVPAVEHLEKLGCDTTSEYSNLQIYLGCCAIRFGLSEEKVNECLEKGYRFHLDNIKKHPNAINVRDAIVGVINVCYTCLEIKNYEKELFWVERLGELLKIYDQQADGRADYADKQQARYFVYLAAAYAGLGREAEADESYKSFLQTEFSQTVEGTMLGADYLCIAGQWEKAADNYSVMDDAMDQFSSGVSLESVQKMLLKKYDANMRAGRIDSAHAVSMYIVEHLDSAITQSRHADALEENAVHQKELEMVAEREEILRQRLLGRLAIMGVLMLALLVYIVVRHEMQNRLKRAHDALKGAHNELKEAYNQLEETTTAKERMESELRIARDIQMSMVPSVFPDVEGLSMYASMTPAKEVGGDLYSYLQQGNKLYFCIGDVSGKGVPASLFMAQATRLFRTLASQAMKPAEILTHMNAELAEDNEQGMFVTMIICLLDLKSGRLEFSNAGHNPPVIGTANNQFSFLDMQPNAPVGLWPELEYEGETIDDISNKLLLLYTDGLNEAENQQQEQYGEDRIIRLLTTRFSNNTHDIVEALETDVNNFREGAEPNDDLTMLALMLKR
jgi:serine phosphatase RsbU (regulator of sigma subunit)